MFDMRERVAGFFGGRRGYAQDSERMQGMFWKISEQADFRPH